MVWSIFTCIITPHGLGGFSVLINGLIAAAIGTLGMLTSEPTAKKQCKEDTYVCPLTLATLHYILRCSLRLALATTAIASMLISLVSSASPLAGVSLIWQSNTLGFARVLRSYSFYFHLTNFFAMKHLMARSLSELGKVMDSSGTWLSCPSSADLEVAEVAFSGNNMISL